MRSRCEQKLNPGFPFGHPSSASNNVSLIFFSFFLTITDDYTLDRLTSTLSFAISGASFLSATPGLRPGRFSARPNELKPRKSCLFRAFHEHHSYLCLLVDPVFMASTLSAYPVVVAGVFHQSSTRLHQPLLRARQRPHPDGQRRGRPSDRVRGRA